MSTMQIDRLLDTVVKLGASDLHLTVGRQPTIRHHGGLRNLQTKVLESDDMVSLMKAITPERNQQELQEEGGTDYGFAFGDKGRFRVSVFRQKGNISMVLRLIPSRILTFEEIGLPPITKALCRRPRGLFLVTGPTGSGKTTTLATMIDYVNRQVGDRHIITVEDPIEYYHAHQRCVVSQREVVSSREESQRWLREAATAGDGKFVAMSQVLQLEPVKMALQNRSLIVAPLRRLELNGNQQGPIGLHQPLRATAANPKELSVRVRHLEFAPRRPAARLRVVRGVRRFVRPR